MLGSSNTDPFDPSFTAAIESKYGIKLVGTYKDAGDNKGGFGSPAVDFTSSGGSSVVTSVTADAKSPSGSLTAVDWLEMRATSGSLAQTVLFIQTVGGQKPFDPFVSNPDLRGRAQLKADLSVSTR
jgi:hypothetical protein